MKKILFICTGNTCRSQMAEGIANSLGWTAFSAGTKPELNVNSYAVKAMSEIGIDIENQYPKLIEEIKLNEIDIVVTVCSNAETNCPVLPDFKGKKIHRSFPDPADAMGTDEEILRIFRKVRNDIMIYIKGTRF